MRILPLVFMVAALGALPAAQAQQPVINPGAGRVSEWNGYQRLDFEVEGRPCVLVLPKDFAPAKPWIWRTEFFGISAQADLALLGHGWAVAHMDARDMFGGPRAMTLFGRFYAHIVAHAGLSKRVVLEGFSRGALYALNFAAAHPTRIAAMYLDAPVVDLRSWPGGNRASPEWRAMLQAYELNEETFAAYKRNPIDLIAQIAALRVPILVVAGEADRVVPLAENTGALEKRYRDAGGPIQVILKPGADHQPHSLPDPAPIVDFLLRNARF